MIKKLIGETGENPVRVRRRVVRNGPHSDPDAAIRRIAIGCF